MRGFADSRDERGYDILLGEAKHSLARCRSAEEICDIAHIHLDRLFPAASACIYLADANGTRFVAPRVCACQREAIPEFRHYECWAICRGTAHAAGNISDSAPCGHVKASSEPSWHYLCLPLQAGSRILGLLHIEHTPEKISEAGEGLDFIGADGLKLLSGVADEIAVALMGVDAART
jgi:GAF domain-containing protein